MHIVRDDVDPVVNANVVLYLGESAETAAAIQYIINVVNGSGIVIQLILPGAPDIVLRGGAGASPCCP